MHPALEGLLYYLYTTGYILSRDSICIELTEDEILHKKRMMKQLQQGTFRQINPEIHSSIVVLSVIKNYLSLLPKNLFYGIKTREWTLLCNMLPDPDDSASEQATKLDYCKSRAENLFTIVKAARRNFSHLLMTTLHQMVSRSLCPNAAIALIAQYLGPVLMHERGDRLIHFTVRGDLVACMKFLISEAPDIFNLRNMILPSVFLAHDENRPKAIVERADEALVVFTK